MERIFARKLDAKIDFSEELKRLQTSFVKGSLAHVNAVIEVRKKVAEKVLFVENYFRLRNVVLSPITWNHLPQNCTCKLQC